MAHTPGGSLTDMAAGEQGILSVNAGSSSVKLALYALAADATLVRRARLTVEGIGRAPRFAAVDADGTLTADDLEAGSTHEDGLRHALDWVALRFPEVTIAGVGHRVVHGGSRFLEPTRVDASVLDALRPLNDLAPLHEPHNIRGIETLMGLAPGVPHIACFDTAFHATMAGPAATFALPRGLREQGVRRYGFHGISYEYIAGVLPEHLGAQADGRVIVAHLGHGASMCAMRGRRSVATTMSMTPLDGLPMGTRCGQLDPGVVLYLQAALGMTVEEVNHLLYYESGLLGLSGVSAYMEVLLASDDPRAHEAIAYFVDACARSIGSLAAVLGGLDALVFTAGIGERAVEVRRRVIEASAWLGLGIDEAANAAHGPRISSPESVVSAWVIPTDEELVLAREVAAFLAAGT